jgi:outer membrane protein assembly factor BamB
LKSLFSSTAIIRAAWVAALFSVVVCTLLLWDFSRRTPKLPLDSPEYLQLHQQLEQQPDATTQESLRELDAQLRAQYFRQKDFTRRGAFLLVGGVAVTLLLAHWAATLRRRLPAVPVTTMTAEPTVDERRLSQWAVVGLAAALLVFVLAVPWLFPNILPAGADLPAVAGSGASSGATEAAVTGDHPEAPAPAETLPSPEQIAANWPCFRGPSGSGVSAFQDLPTDWDGASGSGIRWKTAVPLPGVNSPIVWEQRVFLTGADAERREVYCFDAENGQLLWQRAVAPPRPEVAPEPGAEPKELEVNEDTGYAAPTAATDGHRVYAMFANGDLAAFDFSGKELWSQSLGMLDNPYGHAASLATYKNWVIVQLDQGAADDQLSRLFAIQGDTGQIVWQVPRDIPASWSSPIVVSHEGQPQIITAGAPWVIAYAADDGREIWRADCLRGDVGPSPVYSDGIVFVANDGADAVAIRAGGEGDVTETHVLWKNDIGLPDICSPLATDQYLILIAAYGGLVCYDRVKGGEPVLEEDLGAMFASSPGLAGDRIYLIADDGQGWVVTTTSEECKRIAENHLGERCVTSPAFVAGRIYLRGEQHLFCIGAP